MGLKTVISDMIMRKVVDTGDADRFPVLSPSQLMFFQTPAIMVVLLLLAATEPSGLQTPCVTLIQKSLGSEGPMFMLILSANILIANLLNLAGLMAVQMVGATSYQICGKCNIFI